MSDKGVNFSFAVVRDDYREFTADPNKKVLKDPTRTLIYVVALAVIGAFVSIVSPFIGYGLVFSGSVVIGFFIWNNKGEFFTKLGPDIFDRACSCFRKIKSAEETSAAPQTPEEKEKLTFTKAAALAKKKKEEAEQKLKELREAVTAAEAETNIAIQRSQSLNSVLVPPPKP